MSVKIYRKDFNLKKDTWGKVLLNFCGNLFFTFCIIISLALILFSSVTIESEVEGVSMQPTYNKIDENKKDHVYLNVYDTDYNYGDIVALDNSHNGSKKPIIKRIVGLPGDIIDFVKVGYEYKLERNGEIIDEDYILIDTSPSVPTSEKNGIDHTASRFNKIIKQDYPEKIVNGKFVVGDNEMFVLGDNRHKSLDSTTYGAFTFDKVIGKVELVRYYGESSFKFYVDYIVEGKFIYTLINIF